MEAPTVIEDQALAAAEAVLISGLIHRPESRSAVWAQVDTIDLHPPYRQIAEAVHGLHMRDAEVSILSVLDEMGRRGTLSRAGGAAEVTSIAGNVGDPGYALGVVTRGVRLRRLAALGARAVQAAEQPGTEPLELAQRIAGAAQSIVHGIESAGAPDVPDLAAFLDVEDQPYDWVIPGMLEHGDRLILTGSEGLGKALALDTPVLTTGGWSTMGGLTDGCEVFAPDGSVARVVAATDVMRDRPCYLVRFEEGEEITADAGHMWVTATAAAPVWQVRTTAELAGSVADGHFVPSVAALPGVAGRGARRVVAVVPVESVPVRCIQVDRADGMFVAGAECIPTHNSVLCRQIAVCAAAGVHPFTHARVPQQRVLFIDCENSPQKLRRALRALRIAAHQNGSDPDANMWIEAIPEGLDLTKPDDELWLLQRVTAIQPDLLVIGPIYRLHAANPNDEEPARRLTRVLDRCRAVSNCALMTEAHTSHANGSSERPLRPTGSSLWMRWPEFGYGIREAEDYSPRNRLVSFSSWRGDREERDWPRRLRAGTAWPWEDDEPEPQPTRTEQGYAERGIDNVRTIYP